MYVRRQWFMKKPHHVPTRDPYPHSVHPGAPGTRVYAPPETVSQPYHNHVGAPLSLHGLPKTQAAQVYPPPRAG